MVHLYGVGIIEGVRCGTAHRCSFEGAGGFVLLALIGEVCAASFVGIVGIEACHGQLVFGLPGQFQVGVIVCYAGLRAFIGRSSHGQDKGLGVLGGVGGGVAGEFGKFPVGRASCDHDYQYGQ